MRGSRYHLRLSYHGRLVGNLRVPYERSPGNWVLDSGNNWFLSFLPDGSTRIDYRYTTPSKQLYLEAAKAFIEAMAAEWMW